MPVLNRVRVVWTGVAGSPAYTNLYSVNSAITPGVAQTYTTNLIIALKTVYSPSVTATVEGDVALVDSATGNLVGVSSGAPSSNVGTGGGVSLPPATQIVIRWLTSSFAGGRQVRGRTYLPYLTTNASSAGVVSATTITTVNSAVNAYLAAMGPAAVVYSRANAIAPAISSYSVWNQFGVMRSRRD